MPVTAQPVPHPRFVPRIEDADKRKKLLIKRRVVIKRELHRLGRDDEVERVFVAGAQDEFAIDHQFRRRFGKFDDPDVVLVQIPHPWMRWPTGKISVRHLFIRRPCPSRGRIRK